MIRSTRKLDTAQTITDFVIIFHVDEGTSEDVARRNPIAQYIMRNHSFIHAEGIANFLLFSI